MYTMNQDSDNEDKGTYQVVVNLEEQYSIWPDHKPIPAGWKAAGKVGPKAECLAHIKEVWTDMRPASLRKHMAELERRRAEQPSASRDEVAPLPSEDPLVERLSRGRHSIEVSLRPEKTAKAFKDRIDLGTVHLYFPNTRGGTELAVKLDRADTDVSGGDFERPKGLVHLAGDLTLDYVKVRCIADIDLATLTGEGHLVPA
jgi:uncharacterized protein YbdZ (MbtH family)